MLNKATIWNSSHSFIQVSYIGNQIECSSFSDIGWVDNIYNTYGIPFSYITNEVCSSINIINTIGTANLTLIKSYRFKRCVVIGQIGNE